MNTLNVINSQRQSRAPAWSSLSTSDEMDVQLDSELEINEPSYERMQRLCEVSQCLTEFQNLEATFSKMIDLIGTTLPIISAVVIENRGGEVRTAAWSNVAADDQACGSSLNRARRAFAYMVELSELQMQQQFGKNSDSIDGRAQDNLGNDANSHIGAFLTSPLVLDRGRTFGILQIEVSGNLAESDVKFANTIANLSAFAIDRWEGILEAQIESARSQKAIRKERDDSRRFSNELADEKILRERFVQTLSHDLRTPLASVTMAAQMISRSSALDADELDVMRTLLDNSLRLARMIDSLLDANRLQAGEELPLDLDECDFAKLVREIAQSFRTVSEAEVFVECSNSVIGIWDAGALRRIVENLIGNAIKYRSLDTPVEVSLAVGNGLITLQVKNFGNPLSADDISTLFTQFRRTTSALKGGKAGWGIGLTLVKGLANAHGGRVWVESSIADGTSFFVQIPFDSRAIHASIS